jgi:ABC-2 type transport system ATP-binding protein
LIEVSQLRKVYGDLVAVSDLSFTAHPGEVFGLLGPNGAGKSTTIGCISGLITPSAGTVRVEGFDVAREPVKAKEKLGVVPQEVALYPDLSATENVAYWGAAFGLRGAALKGDVERVLALAGLTERAREPCKNFSGGMKRRLNFAAGIVHRPSVLLLDEPTVGVDPQTRVRLLELVREEASNGTTVLYTTHYMEEAQQLCDRIAVIDRGSIIAQGTLTELRGLIGEADVLRLSGTFDPSRTRQVLDAKPGIEILHIDHEHLRLAVHEGSARLAEILQVLSEAGAQLRETTLSQPSLESLFIKLTGKALRE